MDFAKVVRFDNIAKVRVETARCQGAEFGVADRRNMFLKSEKY